MEENRKTSAVMNGVGFTLIWLIAICVCLIIVANAYMFLGGTLGTLIQPLPILTIVLGNIVFLFSMFDFKSAGLILYNILTSKEKDLSTYKKSLVMLKSCEQLTLCLGLLFLFMGCIIAIKNYFPDSIVLFSGSLGASIMCFVYAPLIILCIFFPLELRLKSKIKYSTKEEK
ncbi:MAG: hypothetical protein IJS47_03980 [Clostridia bacterium]|nr:hypothetical protein [Clostridia bacterium]